MITEKLLIEIERKRFQELCYMLDLHAGEDYTIKMIDVDGFDYSAYEDWVRQKNIANGEYRKLKDIEFDIRNNRQTPGSLNG